MRTEESIYQMAVGHYISRALYVAVTLGLPDLISTRGSSASDIAKAARLHEPSLRRFLRLLAAYGIIATSDDRTYRLTAIGRRLRKGHSRSLRDMPLIFAAPAMTRNWEMLENCLRTGQPTYRLLGRENPLMAFGSRAQETLDIQRRLHWAVVDLARAVSLSYPWEQVSSVVDVGGGTGELLIQLLILNPHLIGVVVDTPAVVRAARDRIRGAGLLRRCRIAGGDFFKKVPNRGDVYLLKSILHDWRDKDAHQILTVVRRAMNSDARLLLIEEVFPDVVDASIASKSAATDDLNLLVSFGGRQRTAGEFAELLADGGFAVIRSTPLNSRTSLLEARPSNP